MANIRKAPAFYTTDEVLERLAISRPTLEGYYRRADEAGDPALAPFRYQLQLRSEWRYPIADLEKWILDAPIRCAAVRAREEAEAARA